MLLISVPTVNLYSVSAVCLMLYVAMYTLYTVQCSHVVGCVNYVKDTVFIRTGNNQRLRNAGNSDRKSKRFCSNAVLCVSFTLQMVKKRVIRLRVFEGPNARDQIAFYTFHSFSGEVQSPNESWLNTCDACVITTCRLGLHVNKS